MDQKFKIGLIFIYMIFLDVTLGKNLIQNNFKNRQGQNIESSLENVIERLQSAANILKNQNPDVKPCDDFYEFTCGNYDTWDEVMQKPKSLYIETRSSIEKQISDVIKYSSSASIKSRPAELVGSLYKICMNESKIETLGLEPLQKILKRLNSWPFVDGNPSKSSFDWIKFTIRAKKMGFDDNYLITLGISHDLDSNKIRITVYSPELEFNNEIFVSGFADKNVKAYYDYMVDTAVLLGSNRTRAEYEMMKVVNFERKLSRLSTIEDEDEFNKTIKTIPDLIKIWPKIDWSRLINKTSQLYGKSSNDVLISVKNPFYISKLEKVLKNTSKKIIANYLAWKIVKESVPYLTKEIQKLHNNYERKRGNFKSKTRSEECEVIVRENLRSSVNYLYVSKHFRDDIKGNIVEMVENIREILMDVLSSVEWLDENTKEHAIQKLKKMKSLIGYPEKMLNEEKLEEFYENLDIDADDDFFETVLSLRLFWKRKIFDMFNDYNRDPLAEFANFYSPLFINAYYIPDFNQIAIPTGILQHIFYSKNRPNYMNYGKIGSIIGHEITHGFDNDGRKFDKNGNFTDWWSAYTNSTYNKKTNCFIDQYNNYTSKSQFRVDGKLTLNENIADIIGARIAYLAYQKWVEKNQEEIPLPEVQYTPNQIFWISYANFWCRNKIKDKKNVVEDFEDPHAPHDVRVIGTLSNIPEFSADFGCPTGSNMNPIKKCTIW